MATTQYITIAEWREGTDLRVLQQLGSDSGTALTGDPPTDTKGILANCIERASARVELAALRGGRYSEVDLDLLVTNDDWTLKGLVSGLSTKILYQRRGATVPDDVGALIGEAKELLEQLASGARIFNVDAAVTAGQPKAERLTQGQRDDLDMVADSEFFPVRKTTTVA